MIEVSNLTKRYGPRLAVDGISFHVQPGEIVGFLGPNGAGKSTTMKVLTGFMPASEGSVKVAGFDVFQNAIDVKRNIGYLPENPPVYLEMSVEDYLEHAALLHQVPKNKVKSAVDSAIQKTNLGEVKKRLIANLSKGFRQRVGLAQALVHNPKVLILDEPTVGLDPRQIIEIRDLIKGLKGEHTVILSSHILPEVTATCQRIIVINKGRIVAQDTLEGLEHRIKHGTLYSLKVKNANDSGLESIRKERGVQSALNTDGHIAIQFGSQTEDTRDLVIEAAVQAKMGVLEFVPEKMSLEEIFLELTTDEKINA